MLVTWASSQNKRAGQQACACFACAVDLDLHPPTAAAFTVSHLSAFCLPRAFHHYLHAHWRHQPQHLRASPSARLAHSASLVGYSKPYATAPAARCLPPPPAAFSLQSRTPHAQPGRVTHRRPLSDGRPPRDVAAIKQHGGRRWTSLVCGRRTISATLLHSPYRLPPHLWS